MDYRRSTRSVTYNTLAQNGFQKPFALVSVGTRELGRSNSTSNSFNGRHDEGYDEAAQLPCLLTDHQVITPLNLQLLGTTATDGRTASQSVIVTELEVSFLFIQFSMPFGAISWWRVTFLLYTDAMTERYEAMSPPTRRFESHSRHEYLSVRFSSVFVLSCICSGPDKADPPSRESRKCL
jgi:hypothetical protein